MKCQQQPRIVAVLSLDYLVVAGFVLALHRHQELLLASGRSYDFEKNMWVP